MVDPLLSVWQTTIMVREYFDGLTGVRSVLAFWVIVGHVLASSGYKAAQMHWSMAWLAIPHYAVQGFMILSGFVIAHLVIGKPEGYGLYLFRRWIRLFPLLLFCVICVLVLAYISPRSFPYIYHRLDNLGLYIATTLSLLHAAIPNRWLSHASTGILAPAWSTSLEMQFYIVAPILILPLVKRRFWLLGALLVLSFPLTLQWHYRINGLIWSWGHGGFLPHSLFYFVIGIGAYGLFRSYPSISRVFTPFYRQPFVWLGEISYSLYMTHIIVMNVVRAWLLEPHYTRQDWQWMPILMVLTIVGTIAVSALTYRFVEMPFISMGRRLGRTRPTTQPVSAL